MVFIKEIGDLVFGFVHRRRDDMAGIFLGELDNIFAKIGLDRLDIIFLEKRIEGDFLTDHGFGFGRRARPGSLADLQDGLTRLFRGHTPMHLAAAFLDLGGETIEIEIKMFEAMVFDLHRCVAQRLELRQARRHLGPLDREAGRKPRQCLL